MAITLTVDELKVRISIIIEILYKIYILYKQGASVSKIQEYLKSEKEVIRNIMDVDYKSPVHAEYDKQKAEGLSETPFLKELHGLFRMAVFALEYAQEHMTDGAKITIYDDDPIGWKGHKHNSTYILRLHNDDPYIRAGKASGKVQDFDGIFVSQESYFDGKWKDTTYAGQGPYDSYIRKYAIPVREFDAKSHLWTTGKHSHDVHYIIKTERDTNGNYSFAVGRVEYTADNKPVFKKIKANLVLDELVAGHYAEMYTFIAELIDSGILDMIPYESILGEEACIKN